MFDWSIDYINVSSYNLQVTRNTFYKTWYLAHSRVQKSMAKLCKNFGDETINEGQIAYLYIANARNACISTSGQKSDVTVVFADPDFL